MDESSTVRIAMIGCGAVAELFHLPAAARTPGCRVSLLVDKDRARLKQLAKTHRVPAVTDDYREVKQHADAAIVALPHHLHKTVCEDLLQNGIHVLVEKPMAMSSAECAALLHASRQGRAVLAVGLVRRFLPNVQWIHDVIASGLFGKLQSFDVQDGGAYNWPVHSDFFLRRETAGGGVLFDTGAHALDQVLYWMGGVAECAYWDDSYGGVEADCRIEFTMTSGVKGTLELSRTRNLRNTALFRFDAAEVEVAMAQNLAVVRAGSGAALAGFGFAPPVPCDSSRLPAAKQLNDLFDLQLADWLAAIREAKPPSVPGEEAARSIALIERCYAARRPLDLPWMRFDQEGSAT